jgi:hypothetical protein
MLIAFQDKREIKKLVLRHLKSYTQGLTIN